MRKFVFASLLVGLCFMPFESDAQFFKKIGNAIKSAAFVYLMGADKT